MKAPDRCLYCKGDNPDCGFCEMGVPLDTQEDWDNSWGAVFRVTSEAKPLTREELEDAFRFWDDQS